MGNCMSSKGKDQGVCRNSVEYRHTSTSGGSGEDEMSGQADDDKMEIICLVEETGRLSDGGNGNQRAATASTRGDGGENPIALPSADIPRGLPSTHSTSTLEHGEGQTPGMNPASPPSTDIPRGLPSTHSASTLEQGEGQTPGMNPASPPSTDIPGELHGNQIAPLTSTSSASTSKHGEDQTSEENPEAPPSFHEFTNLLNDIKATNDIDVLIPLIKKILQSKKSMQQNNPVNDSTGSQEPQQMEEEKSLWTSLTNKGSKFLNYIKDSVTKKNWHEGIKTTAEILQVVSKVKSVVGWLSIISYLLSTIEKGIDNQTECLNLLEDMINLAEHVKHLENSIQEEKFKNAIKLIVEGSITCYSQLKSQIFLRTIIATVNSETLSSIGRKINKLTQDLILTVVTNIDARIPRHVPPKPPLYPHWAVGIKKPVEEVLRLLTATENSLAVVIYGVGGIGKSTVADAVVAEMKLDGYNYTKVKIYEDEEKNDFKSLQQQILKDCFPNYNSERLDDGQDELIRAFECKNNKPIFLFIDNDYGSYGVNELLPGNLEGLPKGSRILVTTRKLSATDMFEESLEREAYCLSPLGREDALKILFKNSTERDSIEKEYIERILKICSGVPLALKIVSHNLLKNKNEATRCDELLMALEKGGEIKKLSNCLVDFVYGELDEHIREAFLDICCFSLSNWKLQDVKYIVGAEAVNSLLETGLITSTSKQYDSSTMYFKGEEELIVQEIIIAKGRRWGKDNRIVTFKSFGEAADNEKLGEIKGVWLIDDTSEHPIDEEQLNLMTKSLRVLALGKGITVRGASNENFEELSFLHIGGSITQFPVKLEALDKLTVFHGPFSVNGEVTLWKLPSSLLAMKVMEQSHDEESENSEMERDFQCTRLQKLHFTGLRKLHNLPRLDVLKTFIVDDFSTMEMLPEQFWEMPALNVLSITKSLSLECLPESFGKLTTLTELRLSNFLVLKELCFNFSQFRSLTHLDLEGCLNLKSFPSNFELPTTLTHLSLSGCKSLEVLPSNFEHLTALKYLNLNSCEQLQALPSTFKQLTALEYFNLNLCYCEKLEQLPFVLGELRVLKCLECSLDFEGNVKGQIREQVLIIPH